MNKTVSKHILVLSLLFSTPAFCTPADDVNAQLAEALSHIKLDYKDPVGLMKDFINVSVKPEKPITYWAMQLYLLLESDAKLQEFRKKILPLSVVKDPVKRTKGIQHLFIHYQNKFSDALRTLILSNFKQVAEALKYRSAKV